ncbi:MAG: glycosyltransferase family 2 protein [bacterium]|nr:glycosyltransferase family 2 protein [Candidatus Kapabacteria bacterium]
MSQSVLSDISIVVVNFQTPDLLDVAVRSIKQHYPDVPLVIVDNGSRDESKTTIEQLLHDFDGGVRALWLNSNVGHGPAMHAALLESKSEWLFFLDSDTKTLRGGFLEEMLERGSVDNSVFGVGEIAPINKRGYLYDAGVPALVAAFMLINRHRYLAGKPFENHGAPGVRMFWDANARGLRLVDYPIQDYIDHLCRGTVRRFGYASLGIAAKVNDLLQKIGL